jgi:glycosyltransferase involved in cell wall biosynthesis
MKVSIVIPTHNRVKFLGECISSVLLQHYPKSEYEILVVDDGSTDSTSQLMSQIEEKANQEGYTIRYLKQENQGPSSARNLGWRNAAGEIIAFIDDDCIAAQDWLHEISSGYEKAEVAGVCGNVFAVKSAHIVSQFLAFEKLHESPYYDKYGQIVYPITCNASFRKSILKLVNGFDEHFPYPGGEDVDLGIQVRKRGYYFIDNRNAIIKHYHKFTISSLLRTWYRYGKGGAQWQLKNRMRLISVINSDGEKNQWIIKQSDTIHPYLALIKHLFRIANMPGDIKQGMSKGVKFSRSMMYFSLRYSRDMMYHIGQIVGYHKVKSQVTNAVEKIYS